jgi:hypothetical protein
MKRFLMLVGVAVVAAAMYVAAAPGSQQSKGPTARQFKALKNQVASLSKTLKKVKTEADAAVLIIGNCYLTVSGSTVNITAVPVSQFGSTTDGFLYGAPSSGTAPVETAETARTALDINPSTPTHYLQDVNPSCLTGSALRHGAVHSGSSLLQRWARHTR